MNLLLVRDDLTQGETDVACWQSEAGNERDGAIACMFQDTPGTTFTRNRRLSFEALALLVMRMTESNGRKI